MRVTFPERRLCCGGGPLWKELVRCQSLLTTVDKAITLHYRG